MQADNASSQAAVPRYREIHDSLRQQITSGSWPPGHKLPTEPELAKEFGCARMTISRALAALADGGLITRRRRAGTVVNIPRAQESVLEIHDIEAEVTSAGQAYQYECYSRRVRRALRADALLLGVSLGTPLLALSGLHRADLRPHALEDRLINLTAVPDARHEKFTRVSPGRWLLTRVPWTEAEHQISALNADKASAQRLGIGQNKACLCIERATWLGHQRITYARIVYPADQHRLVARFKQPP